ALYLGTDIDTFDKILPESRSNKVANAATLASLARSAADDEQLDMNTLAGWIKVFDQWTAQPNRGGVCDLLQASPVIDTDTETHTVFVHPAPRLLDSMAMQASSGWIRRSEPTLSPGTL
ncbi:hypothetical protein E4U55_001396, partial [Claviceps digitariae]